jgi:hypothetical protein
MLSLFSVNGLWLLFSDHDCSAAPDRSTGGFERSAREHTPVMFISFSRKFYENAAISEDYKPHTAIYYTVKKFSDENDRNNFFIH